MGFETLCPPALGSGWLGWALAGHQGAAAASSFVRKTSLQRQELKSHDREAATPGAGDTGLPGFAGVCVALEAQVVEGGGDL